MRLRIGYAGTRVEITPDSRLRFRELTTHRKATEFVVSVINLGLTQIDATTRPRGGVGKQRASVWVEVSESLLARAKESAKLSGMSFSDWFRTALELRFERELQSS